MPEAPSHPLNPSAHEARPPVAAASARTGDSHAVGVDEALGSEVLEYSRGASNLQYTKHNCGTWGTVQYMKHSA